MNSRFHETPINSYDCETVIPAPGNTGRRPQLRPAARERFADSRRDRDDATPRTHHPHSAAPVLTAALGVCLMGCLVVVFAIKSLNPLLAGLGLIALASAPLAVAFADGRVARRRGDVHETCPLAQYRLITHLGAGGMGEVYLAEHRMLQRPCAIKLIRPDRAGDPLILARFEREVRMAARLSHWNTIGIFDYGRTADGTFFYVMEYLPGLSLEELVDRHGPLPAGRVVHLLRQMCHGLREAHAMGLVHRDIKPGNVFLAECGGVYDVVKLLDFGLVKPVVEIPSSRLTHEGAIVGTPLFMSPEQASSVGRVDPRSDIYSLGALAYTLLVGRPPFERTSPLEVLIAHARDAVTPPSQDGFKIAADLEQVVLRCLAKNPSERYQDVDSLERALARCEAAGDWSQAQAAFWWRNHVRASEPAPPNDALAPAGCELAA